MLHINVDYNIVIITAGLKGLVLSVFINGIKIMDMKRTDIIDRIKTELIAGFSIVNMGPISFYFSLKIHNDQE